MRAAPVIVDASRRSNASRWLWGVLGAIVVVLAACSSPQESATGEDADAAVEDVESDVTTDAGTTDAGPVEDDDAEPIVEEGRPRPDLGLPDLALTTPVQGGGQWPELSWETVASADRYTVTLYDPDGLAYWAWRGSEPTVVAGGFNTPPEEGSGVTPRVRAGMTWDVVARDASGELIAQSGVRPIEP
jgi:hypothetical protein